VTRRQLNLTRLLSFDERILLHVRRFEKPRLTKLMRTLTRLGDTPSWVATTLALAALGGQASRAAMLIGTGAILGASVAQVLKRLCQRSRPNDGIKGFTALHENPDRFSFPSGHTTTAFAVAVAVTGEGVFLGPLCLAFATSIGVSRVYLGSHYPLDVVVGAVLGSVIGLLTTNLKLWF
jgi:undecaprenyl-diphosphatase